MGRFCCFCDTAEASVRLRETVVESRDSNKRPRRCGTGDGDGDRRQAVTEMRRAGVRLRERRSSRVGGSLLKGEEEEAEVKAEW